MSAIQLSVVIPVYNEEQGLQALFDRLYPALDKLAIPYEVIFVNDGSRDRSLELLTTYSSADRRVKVISFRRNFGQTAAMDAGFRHASGQIVIPMDADLQNDPADIPAMLKKLDEGFDAVSGWRKDRQDAFLNRKLRESRGSWRAVTVCRKEGKLGRDRFREI